MPKIKILYVEDEPFLGRIIKESLERQNYKVLWVTDGNEAITQFNEFHPNICLLDVMLPNKSGFDVGQEIRRLNQNISIIFLTAKDQTTDVVKGFKSGGNDYLKKPFSVEELIVRIENLITLKTTSSETVANEIKIGNYTFNLSSLNLRGYNKVVKLAHRETELLKILIDHINIPVERRFILNEIWGDDHYFNSRNLDVYIRKLRKHFHHDPNIQIITLKGVGYQFAIENKGSSLI